MENEPWIFGMLRHQLNDAFWQRMSLRPNYDTPTASRACSSTCRCHSAPSSVGPGRGSTSARRCCAGGTTGSRGCFHRGTGSGWPCATPTSRTFGRRPRMSTKLFVDAAWPFESGVAGGAGGHTRAAVRAARGGAAAVWRKLRRRTEGSLGDHARRDGADGRCSARRISPAWWSGAGARSTIGNRLARRSGVRGAPRRTLSAARSCADPWMTIESDEKTVEINARLELRVSGELQYEKDWAEVIPRDLA